MTLEEWKAVVLAAHPTATLTQETGQCETYEGDVGDYTAHTGPDMQADVVGGYLWQSLVVHAWHGRRRRRPDEVTLKDRLQFLQEGSRVMRFHARPGCTADTDGRHQHGVALLCYLLSPLMPSADLLMAALTHDLAEQATGDTPAPTKWQLGIAQAFADHEAGVLLRYGYQFALTAEEQRLLHLADSMDGLLHCCWEAALGNRNVVLVYGKWATRARASVQGEREVEILNAIEQIWEESNGKQGPQFDVFA